MHVHSNFVTKCQRGVLDDEMPARCEEIMRKVCEDFEAELKEFNGERDQVYLLVHYPPQEFTGRINRAITHGHLWSPSYFSASCGGAPSAIVRQYIEQQKRPLQGARQSSLETHSSPT
ncbi:hypothetical protein AQJ66_09255 [Streptomyces bungoensis]|uniref:Transposase IS200-like domain-containing protein n=1 Tax=Streptomyces bungoensis TaxID=285568 RepID=A0A101T8X7_9ACTN|nr:hypothetical protein AQJ66_09255 [Streptomyces bungoensis]